MLSCSHMVRFLISQKMLLISVHLSAIIIHRTYVIINVLSIYLTVHSLRLTNYLLCIQTLLFFLNFVKYMKPCLMGINRKFSHFLGLSVFAVIIYTYSIWTTYVFQHSDGQRYCVPSLTHARFLTITGNIDSIITMLLPFLIIALLNIRIVVAMLYHFQGRTPHTEERRVFHTRLQGTDSNTSGALENMTTNHAVTSSRNRTQLKITKMLILVSTAFLLLNLPSHAIRIYMYVMKMRGLEHQVSRSTIMWQQICQVSYKFLGHTHVLVSNNINTIVSPMLQFLMLFHVPK